MIRMIPHLSAAPILALADLLCRAEAIQHSHSSRGDPADSLQIGTLSIHWMFFGKFAHFHPFTPVPSLQDFDKSCYVGVQLLKALQTLLTSSKYETALSDMKRMCKCKHLEGTVEVSQTQIIRNHPESHLDSLLEAL